VTLYLAAPVSELDADDLAGKLAALVNVPPRSVHVEITAGSKTAYPGLLADKGQGERASAVPETSRVHTLFSHPRASPVCARSALSRYGPPALSQALGVQVLDGMPFCLTLLHVNDQHARVEPVNARLNTWGSREDRETNATKYGGAPLVWGALGALRDAAAASGRHTLVVDAGDEFQGTPYFTVFKGNLTASILKAAGMVGALALGNHEFDLGPEGVARYLDNLLGHVPVLAHNIDVAREPLLSPARFADTFYPAGYRILNFSHAGGSGAGVRHVRVAVVGVTTEATPEASNPGKLVLFREPAAALQDLIPVLKVEKAVDHVVVLSHCGVEKDRQIARSVPGVSAIVGGHSHTLLWHALNVTREATGAAGGGPGVRGGPSHTSAGVVEPAQGVVGPLGDVVVPVVQARAFSRFVGELEVCWPGAHEEGQGRGASAVASLEVVDLREGAFPEHPAVAALAAQAAPAVERYKHTIVGQATADVSNYGCYEHDCAAGLLIANAYLHSAFAQRQGAQVALHNAGGTRATYPAGDVTLADVITVQPFQNELVVCTLSGASLARALEHGLGAAPLPLGAPALAPGALPLTSPKSFPQLAGVHLVYDPALPPGARLVSATVGGAALNASRPYTLVTTDFIMRGGDGFDSLGEECTNAVTSGPLDSDATVEYFHAHSPLDPKDLPRATERAQAGEVGTDLVAPLSAMAEKLAVAGAGGVPEDPFVVDRPVPQDVLRLAALVPGGAHPCVTGVRRGIVTWGVCGLEPGHVVSAHPVEFTHSAPAVAALAPLG